MNETIFIDLDNKDKFDAFVDEYTKAVKENEFNITKFFKEFKEKKDEQ